MEIKEKRLGTIKTVKEAKLPSLRIEKKKTDLELPVLGQSSNHR